MSQDVTKGGSKVLADIVKIRSGSRMGFYSTTDVNMRGKCGCRHAQREDGHVVMEAAVH